MGMIKTKEEIEKLKRSALLGDNCFEHIIKYIKIGMTEIEIADEMKNYFLKNGASNLSFDTIVGSGTNSAFIHSTPTDRKIQNNDIILLDFGCILDGYCSDTSRTIFIGKPSDKQIKIYNLVKDAHDTAIQKIKIGMPANEVDALGRDNIKLAGYDYAHALGHGVGVEVHEDPVISPKRDIILEENMVFTIEPGIYIENEFGVRIEDTGILTKDGFISFSNSSRDIIML